MNLSTPQLSIQTFLNPFNQYSDSREHGFQGPSRSVRLTRVTPPGGGAICKNEDGTRCAVTGKEVLRIVRVSDPSHTGTSDHKSSVGKGGFRIDASRNLWEGSGLKIDSASTDIAWGHGVFNNKILTSARNGELILWDINKSGGVKYERRSKDHIRSIHRLSVSHIVHHYCVTGSADGHMRVWDLRDLSKSIMRVHHPISVRSLVFSPSPWQPLQAVVGLDNGSIYRWDLKMGQRGQLDKIPVAHTASVTALDWCSSGGVRNHGSNHPVIQSDQSSGLGWIVSGGLDKCVKVWDLTAPGSSTHIPSKPTYILHPSFPVRRIEWRPEYECELAVVSGNEYAVASSDAPGLSNPNSSGFLTRVGSGLEAFLKGAGTGDASVLEKITTPPGVESKSAVALQCIGDAIEIWDVRRGWIAKWSVTGSAAEGGVTDISFGDSHALWAQHNNGSFSQMDLRETTKPLDSIPRVAATWEPTGSMTFVTDQKGEWELPYDDSTPDPKQSADLRKTALKALGDIPTRSSSQTVATFAYDFAIHDLETFTALARRYIFEGRSQEEICQHNAAVAFSAGHDAAAQVWMLLHAALSRYLPERSPSPPSVQKSKKIPTPLSAQRSPHMHPLHSSSARTPDSFNFPHKTSPSRRQTDPITLKTGSISRGRTPISSAASSPRHPPVHLPPTTPRRASFFSRRESVDAGVLGRSALLRRPSISVNATSLQAASPNERNASSLRHVGEGVLDSDSSSEEEDEEEDEDEDEEEGNETAGENSSDEEPLLPPMISPTLAAPRVIPAPSPLSRGHHAWTESEDDTENVEGEASSPSPQSTDTESDGSSPGTKRVKLHRRTRRNSVRPFKQSRSRSSTLASLAAPHPPLTHQDSHTSIRTITADSPNKENTAFGQEEHSRNLHYTATTGYQFPGPSHIHQAQNHSPHDMFSTGHRRQKSQTFSEFRLGRANSVAHGTSILTVPASQHERETMDAEYGLINEEEDNQERETTARREEVVEEEERSIAQMTLETLREALEEFADEGDVQMCSMLALVAPNELNISNFRATRFLDAYLDFLNRLRLYTCAAYIRKYCHVDEIKKYTLIQSTIYTACGRCRKPLLMPATNQGPLLAGTTPSTPVLAPGAFAFCITCRSAVANCAICRLPVRSLLFQCTVCHHGGHAACYEQYYMETPMRDLPTTTVRYLPGSNASSGDDIGVSGATSTGIGGASGNTGRGRSSKASETAPAPPPVPDDDAISMTSGISTQSQSRTIFPSATGFDSPGTTSPVRGTPGNKTGHSRTGGDSVIYTRLAGHPCASGCGHFCWAASAVSELLTEDL